MTPNATPPCPECGQPVPADSPHQLCPACLMAQALASRTVIGGDDAAADIPPPLSPEEIAEKFPQFEITECLGRGGMGAVYKARQKSLDRWVAIKILAPEREGRERFAERFAREAQTLARLSHPHIVTIHDFGQTGGLFYLVMEYVDGVNLRDLLRDGKLEPAQALAIVPPICDALQYAHDKGIVHRDIKPENLLLDRDGRIKIADFGIASLVGAENESTGTPAYMAPEQADAQREVDHRADLYALGVVLYEMLTGERPGNDALVVSSKLRGLQIDVRIDPMVLKALEKSPEKRFQTAGDFRTVVEMAAATPVHAKPTAVPPEGWIAGRVSRAAALGFFLIPVFFAAALLVPGYIRFISQVGIDRVTAFLRDNPTPYNLITTSLLVLLTIMGGAVPVLTTWLGWSAVSQIRRSAGKLQGMWVAVFDGLFFPLLTLNAVLLWGVLFIKARLVWASLTPTSGTAHLPQVATWEIILPTLLLGVIIDWLIVSRVWRAMTDRKDRAAESPSATPSAGFDNRSSSHWAEVPTIVASTATLPGARADSPHSPTAQNVKPGALGKWALGVWLATTLGGPLLWNVMGAKEVLLLCLLALLLATVLGAFSWRSRAGKFATLASAMGLVMCLAIGFAVLNPPTRTTKYPRHRLPEGYEGFVVMIYDQPSPPFGTLAENGRYQTMEYPADGILITGSSPRFGLNADQVIETYVEPNKPGGTKMPSKWSRYESGGTHTARDGLSFHYLVKAVGSDEYWRTRNVADYHAKLKEAEQKLRDMRAKWPRSFQAFDPVNGIGVPGISATPAAKAEEGYSLNIRFGEGRDAFSVTTDVRLGEPFTDWKQVNGRLFTIHGRVDPPTNGRFPTELQLLDADVSEERKGITDHLKFDLELGVPHRHTAVYGVFRDYTVTLTRKPADAAFLKARLSAAEPRTEEALITGGRSPDGSHEIRVRGWPHDPPYGYSLHLYAKGKNEPIHSLDSVGTYLRYGSAKERCTALWHASGRYVFVTNQGSRHSQEGFLLAVTGERVEMLQLPGFIENALGRVAASNSFRGAITTPEQWVGDDLHLKVGFDTAEGFFTCQVVAEVSGSSVRLKSCSMPVRSDGGDGSTAGSPPAEYALICYASPALNSIKQACPETFDAALYPLELHHEVDAQGEGIVWRMAHWLEAKNPPNRNDRVKMSDQFRFEVISHAVVVRGFWTYQQGDDGRPQKKSWEWRTVAHETAEDALAVIISGEKEIVYAEPTSNNGRARPIYWNGKIIGEVTTALSGEKGQVGSEARWHYQPLGRRPTVLWHSLEWSFYVNPATLTMEPSAPWPASRPNFQVPAWDEGVATRAP